MNAAMLLAKLAGIRRAVGDLLKEDAKTARPRMNFDPSLVGHYFGQSNDFVNKLRVVLPELYGDFQPIETLPTTKMVSMAVGVPAPVHFGRQQLERLARDIDQVFEIRAHSELQQPAPASPKCVFITHGRASDWREVQAYIEHDVAMKTIELAEQPNLGRTQLEKLLDTADRCDSAVIVMTGDDVTDHGEARVRENVMHEIGYFQGRYGRGRVIFLYEEGVNVPSNLAGVVYSPFPKGRVSACFHLLQRELKAMYGN